MMEQSKRLHSCWGMSAMFPMERIRKLIFELTEGEIVLSDGMINGLCKEFSAKTEPEKKEIIRKLMLSPVMNADFTNARVNGH